MTQHILVFVNKKGKEVDRIYMNSPVNSAWEGTVIKRYKKRFPEKYKRLLKQLNITWFRNEYGIFNQMELFNHILCPLVRYADENEVVFRVYTADRYKQYGAVTLLYTKESGWATDKDEEDLIDSKEKYDYVVWSYNDLGEFDKGTALYKKLMEFVKAAINIHRRKIS